MADADNRFLDPEALMKAITADWPQGADVMAVCHRKDRELVKAEIEQKYGFNVVGYVDASELPYPLLVPEGKYSMIQKKLYSNYWLPRESATSSRFWSLLDRPIS